MTHDEALLLLPGYALGALDGDVDALEAHLADCPRCTALLATYLETTATLGAAVEQIAPPARLRAAVLAHAPPTVMAPRAQRSTENGSPRVRSSPPVRLLARILPIAATLLLVVGLAAGNVAQQQQLRASQSELALDRQGLALLTSTETTVERLAPTVNPNGPQHGHWYHRSGITTQVVVVEFMPNVPPGQSYYGWLQHANGSWQAVGSFTLNDQGYGRVILLGSDGSDVRAVEVTRQAQPSTAPNGPVVLSWSAS